MKKEMKMTKLSQCAGCGAKVGGGILSSLLDGFKTGDNRNLITGFDKCDDACAYDLGDGRIMVQTTDFFPPIADDPYMYGRIAAANAMSDIYAMGAEPEIALNILCVSRHMDDEAVREILRGGYDAVYEAGATIAGGHTIRGEEPVYGMAVTGFAKKEELLLNSTARPGDSLILTKPLGIGILVSAQKAGFLSEETSSRILEQMATLNKTAHDIVKKYDVSACTDVTGFGLIGHAFEMAQAGNVSVHISSDDVIFHREAEEFARMGLIPEGAYSNREYVKGNVCCNKSLETWQEDIFYDPQTSGGLLFAVDSNGKDDLLRELQEKIPEAHCIGFVSEAEDFGIYIE